jgi:hypothetical protein
MPIEVKQHGDTSCPTKGGTGLRVICLNDLAEFNFDLLSERQGAARHLFALCQSE